MGYKVTLNANVEIETMTYLDKLVAAGDGKSRGAVIDRAMTQYREKALKDAEKTAGRK